MEVYVWKYEQLCPLLQAPQVTLGRSEWCERCEREMRERECKLQSGETTLRCSVEIIVDLTFHLPNRFQLFVSTSYDFLSCPSPSFDPFHPRLKVDDNNMALAALAVIVVLAANPVLGIGDRVWSHATKPQVTGMLYIAI